MMMGSIELARTICEELKGELPDGEQYGSVDIAEILSAHVRNLENQRDNIEALYLGSVGNPLCSYCGFLRKHCDDINCPTEDA